MEKSRRYRFDADKSFELSRSKLDLFMECPRCFYLDRKLGIPRPPGFPFSLNNAVDLLLKKEFDVHRAKGTPHPLMKTYGIDAVPLNDPRMEEWRDARRKGVRFLHEPTDILMRGGIDDVWVDPEGKFIVVDYKATAKSGPVGIDAPWQISYKRQVEVYQWLFRGNGFQVSDTAYFVYCNGAMDREAFDGRLEFSISVIPYKGSTQWIAKALESVRAVIDADDPPQPVPSCEYCAYRAASSRVEAAG